jgi:hypothetical protein
MKPIHTSMLCFLMLLAVVPGALQASDLSTVELSPTATPGQIQAAKDSFDNGSIVVMKGGTVAGFEALLNLSMPKSNSLHRQPPPCVQAARKMPSGRVRKFIRMTRPFAAGDDAVCAAAFTKWLGRQDALEEEASIPNWTGIEDFSLAGAWNGTQNDSISLDLSVYRANTVDPTWDYYLVLNTMTLVPRAGNGISIPTYFVSHAEYQNGIPASIYGSGPQQNSGTISVGQGISFDQNGTGVYTAPAALRPFQARVNNPFGQNWSIWEYVQNSSPYAYQTAIIYKVPTGTTHFTLSCIGSAVFYGDPVNTQLDQAILIPISAPQVLLPELTFAMEGSKSSFDVAVSPYLQTAVSGQPGWMPQGSILFTDPNGNQTQTPPMGQSSFTVSFNVPASPPCLGDGECANPGVFAMQTDPAYAAIQTKLPAISAATIELVPNSPTAGVLIAGGQDWNGNVLQTADIWDSQSGKVTTLAARMVQARYQHTATLVAPSSDCQGANTSCPTTGQVLIAGGYGANKQPLSSTEFFNPTTAQFTAGPSMTSPHAGAVAMQLQDGRILIMGGLDQTGSATAVVDIYDPRTNSFSSTPMALTQPRWNFAANVLQDGSVLVEGGSKGESEFDGPATGTAEKLDSCGSGFYPLTNGPVVGRQAQATAVLKNGQVLIAGGYNGDYNNGAPIGEVELFTPGTNSFSQLGATLDPGRRYMTLVPEANGQVAVIGGYNEANAMDVYDPRSMSFVNSLYSNMTEARDLPTAVRLEGIGTTDKGKILVAGGVIPNTGSSNGELAEVYDPTTQTWSTAGSLSASRRQNTMTLYGKYAGSLPATFGCQ